MMNIRTLVFSILGLGLVGSSSPIFSMDELAQQQAMMMAMIKHMPEEKVREMADSQFAGDMQAVRTNRANNIRWAAFEGALALILLDGAAESMAKKIAAYSLLTLGSFEVLGSLLNTAHLWILSSEKEALFQRLMNIRTGSHLRDEALGQDDTFDLA